MKIACPTCRAENAEPTCRRCKADLGLLFQLESAREALVVSAWQSVQAGQGSETLASAQSAGRLRQGTDTRRLEAMAFLLCRDFESAYNSYVKIVQAGDL